jgi:hypothetical protein
MINQEEEQILKLQNKKIKNIKNKINSIDILLKDELIDINTKNNLGLQKQRLETDILEHKMEEIESKINKLTNNEGLNEKINNLSNDIHKKLEKRNEEINNIIKEINEVNFEEMQEIKKLKEELREKAIELYKINKKISKFIKYGNNIGQTFDDIGDYSEDKINIIGNFGGEYFNKILKMFGLKKLSPFFIGLILLGLVLFIVYIFFVVILKKPIPQFLNLYNYKNRSIYNIPLPPGDVVEI